MNRTGTVLLEFDPDLNKLRKDKKLWDGLSAVVQIGDTLWVANDEALSLERLSRQGETDAGAIRYANHEQFPLRDFLELPAPPEADGKIEEADIEGLDHDGGYLWLVGSHSLKRDKPKQENSIEKNAERLAKVGRDGNRFLLARIPLTKDGQSLERTVEQNSHSRTAACLAGNRKSNALTRALAGDEHLGPFLAIPGKDNGFDIEGLAVVGDRVFVGLRGPVLRGWALILELALEEQDASTLKAHRIGRPALPQALSRPEGPGRSGLVRAGFRSADSGGSDHGVGRANDDLPLAGRGTSTPRIAGFRPGFADRAGASQRRGSGSGSRPG